MTCVTRSLPPLTRIRNLLLSIHPALERALGAELAHPAVLALMSRYGGPSGLRKAGKARIDAVLKKKAPRLHTALTDHFSPLRTGLS